jgi:hypothetical protein
MFIESASMTNFPKYLWSKSNKICRRSYRDQLPYGCRTRLISALLLVRTPTAHRAQDIAALTRAGTRRTA